MNRRMVVIAAAIAGILVAGCSSNRTAAPTKKPVSRPHATKQPKAPQCQSEGVVYVFPAGSGAAINGSSAWMNLTSPPRYQGNTASLEAVLPSTPSWRVVRLTVPSNNAQAVVQFMHDDSAVAMSSDPMASAQACFTGWNQARLSHFGAVSAQISTAAGRVANGMDFVAPAVVHSGHNLFIIVEQGSVDGETYQEGITGNTAWYAINHSTKAQFPVRLVDTTVTGSQMLAEFALPDDISSGSYTLAFTSDGQPINNIYTGDFAFQVQ